MRHIQIDGKSLRALTTTSFEKSYEGTRLIAEPNGKKVRDWVIRSQAPKPVMLGHGEGSETRCLWVRGD